MNNTLALGGLKSSRSFIWRDEAMEQGGKKEGKMAKALGVDRVTRTWVERASGDCLVGVSQTPLSSGLSQLYQISPLARRVEEVSDLWAQ